jgi:hypothetical protein
MTATLWGLEDGDTGEENLPGNSASIWLPGLEVEAAFCVLAGYEIVPSVNEDFLDNFGGADNTPLEDRISDSGQTWVGDSFSVLDSSLVTDSEEGALARLTDVALNWTASPESDPGSIILDFSFCSYTDTDGAVLSVLVNPTEAAGDIGITITQVDNTLTVVFNTSLEGTDTPWQIATSLELCTWHRLTVTMDDLVTGYGSRTVVAVLNGEQSENTSIRQSGFTSPVNCDISVNANAGIRLGHLAITAIIFGD